MWSPRRLASALGRAALVASLYLLTPTALRGEVPDGLHVRPSVFWKSGDHRVDLGLTVRFRTEAWDAYDDDVDWFSATRTRLRTQYAFRDLVRLFAELQDVRLHGLDTDSTGAAALYRANSGADSNTHGSDIRQLYLEIRPLQELVTRFGRQDIKLGTEVLYPEADWRYLKIARTSQRLVGTVGWTHAERSNDGLSLGWDLGAHHLYGFLAQPTTGVFDVDSAYRNQDDITYGGLSWTVKRDGWLENTELRLFALAYEDDRSTRDGGLSDDVEIYTAGASLISVHPLGRGKADLLLWLAGQTGEFADLDHRAFAALAEAGYRFSWIPWQPWLRIGLNFASGDGDPDDGDHETFFNLLPTNHLYYGFADQLAFQNLLNPFLQLRLSPHPRVGVDLFLHRFSLASDDDARYFGTGAFNQSGFGYGAQPSRGYRHVGTELDAVARVALPGSVQLELGYSYLDGGALLATLGSDPDVHFGYVQVQASY